VPFLGVLPKGCAAPLINSEGNVRSLANQNTARLWFGPVLPNPDDDALVRARSRQADSASVLRPSASRIISALLERPQRAPAVLEQLCRSL